MAKLHPENHVSTCTTDLATCKFYSGEKEILVKPAVVSVENNTNLKVFSDAAINTDAMGENFLLMHKRIYNECTYDNRLTCSTQVHTHTYNLL